MYARSTFEPSPRSSPPESSSALVHRSSSIRPFSPRGVLFPPQDRQAATSLRSYPSHRSSRSLCFLTPPRSFVSCRPANSFSLFRLRTLSKKHGGTPLTLVAHRLALSC